MNGILSNALSALQTNTAALRVVSGNVANINTQGYDRRVVNLQAEVAGGQLQGVSIADIQRVADQFLNQQVLTSSSGSSRYSTQSGILDQLNGLLGQPGDGSSLTSQLGNVASALASASLSPSSSASQQGALNALQNLAATVSNLSSSVSTLQTQVDQQISTSIPTVNGLIQQIYTLNQQIATATAGGDESSGLLDQRDEAVQSLSQYMGVRTSTNSSGQMTVMTDDGVNLVGDTYAQLSYTGGSTNGSYGNIQLSNINPRTGSVIGTSTALDPHLDSGSLKGLIDTRDNTLGDIQQELGQFARQTALAFNQVHNAGSAAPPPSELDGSDTGLLGTDALNFTGQTTVAIADSSGNLVSRVDVDFDAGTLSVDGGASVSIGSTVGSFAAALNAALGSNGSASFAGGTLSISASGSNGVVVQDDASNPSARGGVGFSQFFGLNDLFDTGAPSILSTGLSASDAGGFAAGGTMSFVLKGPDGTIAKQATVSVGAGDTIGDIVNSLNTAFGSSASFALNSGGSISCTPANAQNQLAVTGDTTQRGATGMSFTSLFGLGSQQASALATGFSVRASISAQPSLLAFAQSSMDSSTVAGQPILGSGDNRGLLALQNVGNTQTSFAKAGAIGAQNSTLTAYAGSFYQDVSTKSTAASTAATTESDALTEAQTRQSSTSGVNLDEELSNMMVYQQAYSAGARMLSVAQQLYDSLLQAV
ncbi:MAG TPA: flagellar hook-associated protein FlgK [Rhizomicrobium sp.]|nr:flagellar hook-associated protein FlgK [Rhizomicrobium sp.]